MTTVKICWKSISHNGTSCLITYHLPGQPTLRFKDVCKRVLKGGNINLAGWEAVAAGRSHWMLAIKAGTQAVRGGEGSSGMRGERAQTAESTISTHWANNRIHQQQLQHILLIQNRTVQPQQRLQLDHWPNHGADSIISRDRSLDASNDNNKPVNISSLLINTSIQDTVEMLRYTLQGRRDLSWDKR